MDAVSRGVCRCAPLVTFSVLTGQLDEPVRVRTLQDKAERLMATTGHLFEEAMATYHLLGIDGKVCVHDGRRCGHILASSVLQYRHYRVQRWTEKERSWSVWQLLLNFNTVPQLTRVTAGGMFELESLVMQYFSSHPAYSSDTIPLTLAWHRLSQSGNFRHDRRGPPFVL